MDKYVNLKTNILSRYPTTKESPKTFVTGNKKVTKDHVYIKEKII